MRGLGAVRWGVGGGKGAGRLQAALFGGGGLGLGSRFRKMTAGQRERGVGACALAVRLAVEGSFSREKNLSSFFLLKLFFL